MMSVESTIILVENHGITFVITAGVLYYMFKITNLYYKKLESKIVKDHAKDLKEKWPDTIEKSTIIHQLLYKALYEYKWDRAYIFEYHNGGHSISWIDFLKASNTFEVVNENIQQHQRDLQNLPIGMFAFTNLKILKKETMCIKDIETLKHEDLWIYQMLKQQGIKSMYVNGLFDAQWHPIWFFGIDYTWSEMTTCNVKMQKDLEILTYKIAGLLY